MKQKISILLRQSISYKPFKTVIDGALTSNKEENSEEWHVNPEVVEFHPLQSVEMRFGWFTYVYRIVKLDKLDTDTHRH